MLYDRDHDTGGLVTFSFGLASSFVSWKEEGLARIYVCLRAKATILQCCSTKLQFPAPQQTQLGWSFRSDVLLGAATCKFKPGSPVQVALGSHFGHPFCHD